MPGQIRRHLTVLGREGVQAGHGHCSAAQLLRGPSTRHSCRPSCDGTQHWHSASHTGRPASRTYSRSAATEHHPTVLRPLDTDRQRHTHTLSAQLYQQCRNSDGSMILWWGGCLPLPFFPHLPFHPLPFLPNLATERRSIRKKWRSTKTEYWYRKLQKHARTTRLQSLVEAAQQRKRAADLRYHTGAERHTRRFTN